MIAKPRWLGLVWILSIVVAVWFGSRAGTASRRAAVAPAPAAAPAPRAVALAPVRDGVDAGDLRRIIRDELALHDPACSPSPAAPTPAGAPADPPAPPPLDPALQPQADDAAAIIARAIDAGRWTAADRRRFADAAAPLPPPTVVELHRTLHVAINRGQVTPADGLPPFGIAGGLP